MGLGWGCWDAHQENGRGPSLARDTCLFFKGYCPSRLCQGLSSGTIKINSLIEQTPPTLSQL